MMRLAPIRYTLLSQAAARHDPHLLEGDDGGGGLEIGVVVDHREPVRGGQDRGLWA